LNIIPGSSYRAADWPLDYRQEILLRNPHNFPRQGGSEIKPSNLLLAYLKSMEVAGGSDATAEGILLGSVALTLAV
jgi:hypothetical protein